MFLSNALMDTPHSRRTILLVCLMYRIASHLTYSITPQQSLEHSLYKRMKYMTSRSTMTKHHRSSWGGPVIGEQRFGRLLRHLLWPLHGIGFPMRTDRESLSILFLVQLIMHIPAIYTH